MRSGAVVIQFPRRRRSSFALTAYADDALRTERTGQRLFAGYLGVAGAVLALLQLLASS